MTVGPSPHRRSYVRDLAAIGWLAGVAAAVFWPVLTGRYTFYPFDLLHHLYLPFAAHRTGTDVQVTSVIDYVGNYYPSRVFEWTSLREHRLPLWNPLVWGGHPTLANNGSRPVLDPFNALYLWLNLPVALAWRAYLQDVTCAAFTFLYLRSLGLRRPAAVVGSLAFALNSMFYANIFDWSLGGILWLPLILFLVDRAVSSFSITRCVLAGAALGVGLLSSPLQIAAFLVWAVMIVTIARAAVAATPRERVARAIRVLGISIVLGIGIGAVQILPTLELIAISVRRLTQSGQGVRTPLQMVTGTLALITFVFPPIGGQMKGGLLFAEAWGGTTHFQGYVGVVPLIAAVLATVLVDVRRTAPYIVLGLSSLALVLYTPLSMFLYERFFILYAFAAAVLAALGFDALAEPTGDRSRSANRVLDAFSVATGLVACGALAWTVVYRLYHAQIVGWIERFLQRIVADRYLGNDLALYVQKTTTTLNGLTLTGGPMMMCLIITATSILLVRSRLRGLELRRFVAIAIAIVSVDLWYSAESRVPYVSLKDYPPFPPVQGLERIQRDPDLFRVISLRRYAQEPPLLDTCMFIPYGIQSVQGKDNLYPHNLWTILPDGMQSTTATVPTDFRLLNLENVKYVIVGPATTLPSTQFDLVYGGDIRVYRNRDVLPRAFVVAEVVQIENVDTAVAFLRSERFDPRRMVVLDHQIRFASGESIDAPATTRTTLYRNTDVEIDVSTPTAGVLVLSDTYYPGWRATVDGKPAEVLRANAAMRGVAVEPGHHVVQFTYDPLSFRLGCWITFMTICAMALVVAADRIRNARTTAAPVTALAAR